MAETLGAVPEDRATTTSSSSMTAASPSTTSSPSFLERIRSRSTSRSRSTERPQDFRRMSSTTTSSTATAHNGTEHAHHHGGPLDKLKGVFANRPSSRDRHGDREVSLDRTTTGGTGEAGLAMLHAAVSLLLRERKARLIAGSAKTNHRRLAKDGAFRGKVTELIHMHASAFASAHCSPH